MYPTTINFGRQHIAELTGISDDVLGYWMREGLLRSSKGKDGKGQHRRFDYRQVHIAALLGEMRGIGVNIAGLKAFSAILQRSVEIADSGPWSAGAISTATSVRNNIARFENGDPHVIFDRSSGKSRLPTSHLEIVNYAIANERVGADSSAILALAMGFDDYDDQAAQCYRLLTSTENLLERGVGKALDWDEEVWFVSADPTGSWRVADADSVAAKRSGMRCGVALAVSLIIRRIWVPEPVAVAVA